MRMILEFGKPGDLLPQAERLVVVDIDGHHQPLRRQAEFLGDQVPGQLDRALLEVVAEGEIAEHLEEGVVARRVADVVEVVVLAAGAHAFLRGDGARKRRLRLAGEIVLELHHAGIGEHQGRVVARHERARRDALVAVLGEIVQERCADVVDACHRRTLSARRTCPAFAAAHLDCGRPQCPARRAGFAPPLIRAHHLSSYGVRSETEGPRVHDV